MENGRYKAKPVRAELGEAGTGNAQVGIAFELLDEAGGEITYYGTFTEKAQAHTIKALRVCGWRGDDLSDLSSIGGPDAPEVELVVENEEYQGKWSSKVKWVNAPGGPMMKQPLTGDKAKAFAAKMRGAVLAFDKSSGSQPKRPTPSASSPNPPPLSDDDIPF